MTFANDFLPFSIGVGANVDTQVSWATDPAVNVGFGSGVAKSLKFNKAFRQAIFPGSGLSQFIANRGTADVLDDGNINGYVTNLESALKGWAYAGPTPVARIRLTTPTTFYVGGTGANDSNPGTIALPWATLQHAAFVVNSTYDTGGLDITYLCQGAFTQGIALNAPQVGGGNVTFVFAAGSSITTTNAPCINVNFGAQITISGPVVLSATGATGYGAGCGLIAGNGGFAVVGDQVTFGACDFAHTYGNVLFIGPTYRITGSSPAHMYANLSVTAQYVPATFGGIVAVTLVGTPAFSLGFAFASTQGLIIAPPGSVSFTGAATGIRFRAQAGGGINTGGQGFTLFPGSVGGTADGATFGFYI